MSAVAWKRNTGKIAMSIRLLHNLSLAFILLLSLILRIDVFSNSSLPSYVYTQPDYARDYLIGNHMIRYGEFPLDIHSSTGTITSPVYFYLLSLFLLIKNDIVFLGFVNIFLQVATIIIVCLLARNLFSRNTGLIAAALFGLNPSFIDQSYYLWQPWVMEAFVNLSYLLLFLSYIKINYKLLLFGIFLFIFSGAVHNSVFSFLPIFIFLSFLAVKRCFKKQRLTKYTGIILTTVLSLIFIYLPVWMAIQTTSTHTYPMLSTYFKNLTQYSSPDIFNGLWLSTEILFRYIFPSLSILSVYIFIFLLLIGAILYLLYKKDNHTKLYLTLVIFSLIYFFLIASIVHNMTDQHLPVHYFTPIFGLFIIVVAELIYWFLSKNILTKIFLPLVTILFINLFYSGLNIKLSVFTQQFIKNPVSFLSLAYNNPPAEAIKREVFSIQREENLPNLNFFQIKTYGDFWDNYAAPFFITALEKGLNVKLVSINPNSPAIHHIELETSDDYIFLVCIFLYTDYKSNNCLDKLFVDNPNHNIVKNIYSQKPYSIYLTKRVTNLN